MTFNQSVTMSLEDSLIARAPMGVSVAEGLPGGWIAVIALHPSKRPLVTYHKDAPAQLLACTMAMAQRWAS